MTTNQASVNILGGGAVVPYITAWSSEQALPSPVVHRNRGIAYADESPVDRDQDSVLWARMSASPGVGRPQFKRIHVLRQRRSMRKLLCQVCGEPKVVRPDGTLFLLSQDEYDFAPWPEPVLTSNPPVCPPCARLSVGVCPHLRRHFVVIRARAFALAGVRGNLHVPALPHPVPVRAYTAYYGDPALRWTKASQLLMRVTDYDVIDIDAAT
ncbi:hypothetical protein GQ466_15660 [Actinomadura rayongensis]|uniref:Uncharacterized protein n=2 Tax=Actinomadura rayongensis TaxID=1429076 RepID=A0A6I4W5L5_9ACTN|nr:hypothetical protein [Actinomadura rayongensis]